MMLNNSNDQRHLHYQMILEHAKKTKHKGKTDPIHCYHSCVNPLCGDRISVFLQFNEQNNLINQVKFEGEGCALAMASADIMAEVVTGKTREEILILMEEFRNMVQGRIIFNDHIPHKLSIFQTVAQVPVKIKCVLLSWQALNMALNKFNQQE